MSWYELDESERGQTVLEKAKWAYSDAYLSQTNHAKKSMKRLKRSIVVILKRDGKSSKPQTNLVDSGSCLAKLFFLGQGKLFYMDKDCFIHCFEYSGCELVNSSSASSYVSKWYSIITIMIITMHLHVRIMEMRVLRTPACKCHRHLRACVKNTCMQVS